MTTLVTCPCCKGERKTKTYEWDDALGQMLWTYTFCCHCQGKGVIPAEVEETESRNPYGPGDPAEIDGT